MKRELFKLAPFVSILLKKDNKVLLVERTNTRWYSGFFVLPGGKVDQGETVFQAAARELEEELGIILDLESSKVVHVCHFKSEVGLEGLDFYVEAEKWQGEICNMEPDKHGKIEWFDVNNLPENIFPGHKMAIHEIEKKTFYSERGW